MTYLDGLLLKAIEALEVAALGGYDEELMPEDLVANPYEERGLVKVTRDICDEFDCHMTAQGIDFVRTTIEETRAVMASHPTPDGEGWHYGAIKMGRRLYATRFHPSTEDNDGDLPDVGDTEFWEDGQWKPYSIAAFQKREFADTLASPVLGDEERLEQKGVEAFLARVHPERLDAGGAGYLHWLAQKEERA